MHYNLMLNSVFYYYNLIESLQWACEKGLKVKVKVAHSLWPPQTIQSIEFSRPEYWSGYPFLSPGDLPNPGIKPRSPALQVDSLQAEPQGKPKNTGVGSLSLLQWIILTQESNQGLLHCRWILYQLSYQGSPCSHFCRRESRGSPSEIATKWENGGDRIQPR